MLAQPVTQDKVAYGDTELWLLLCSYSTSSLE